MKPHRAVFLWILIAFICGWVAFSIVKHRAGAPSPIWGEGWGEADYIAADSQFEIRVGDKKVSAWLALTDLERLRGLMRQESLGENEGMLFVYPHEDSRSFWMKNVPMNLSIGFFDSEGKLLEVHEMRAGSTVSTHSDSDRVKYCLEMNAGWFNDIPPETILNLDDVKAAAAQRGFNALH